MNTMTRVVFITLVFLVLNGCSSRVTNRENLDNIAVQESYVESSDGEEQGNLYYAGTRFVAALKKAKVYTKPATMPNLSNYQAKLLEKEIVSLKIAAANDATKEQLTKELKAIEEEILRIRSLEKIYTDDKTTDDQKGVIQDLVSKSNLGLETKHAALHEFLDSGISYSQMLCESFFETSSRAQSTREFIGDGFNLLGGFTAAVQGLTGVEAKIISLTAAAFTFGNSTYEVWENTIGLTPDYVMLYKLVKQEQDKKELNIMKRIMSGQSYIGQTNSAQLPIDTYYKAERALLEYADICTVKGLKQLIDNALLKAQESSS